MGQAYELRFQNYLVIKRLVVENEDKTDLFCQLSIVQHNSINTDHFLNPVLLRVMR